MTGAGRRITFAVGQRACARPIRARKRADLQEGTDRARKRAGLREGPILARERAGLLALVAFSRAWSDEFRSHGGIRAVLFEAQRAIEFVVLALHRGDERRHGELARGARLGDLQTGVKHD